MKIEKNKDFWTLTHDTWDMYMMIMYIIQSSTYGINQKKKKKNKTITMMVAARKKNYKEKNKNTPWLCRQHDDKSGSSSSKRNIIIQEIMVDYNCQYYHNHHNHHHRLLLTLIFSIHSLNTIYSHFMHNNHIYIAHLAMLTIKLWLSSSSSSFVQCTNCWISHKKIQQFLTYCVYHY